MKPKLTGLERGVKMSILQLEAFELWRCGSKGAIAADLKWWHEHVHDKPRWINLARRIRRKVANGSHSAYSMGWGDCMNGKYNVKQ